MDVKIKLILSLARVSAALVGLSEAGVLRTIAVTASALLATLVTLH